MKNKTYNLAICSAKVERLEDENLDLRFQLENEKSRVQLLEHALAFLEEKYKDVKAKQSEQEWVEDQESQQRMGL